MAGEACLDIACTRDAQGMQSNREVTFAAAVLWQFKTSAAFNTVSIGVPSMT